MFNLWNKSYLEYLFPSANSSFKASRRASTTFGQHQEEEPCVDWMFGRINNSINFPHFQKILIAENFMVYNFSSLLTFISNSSQSMFLSAWCSIDQYSLGHHLSNCVVNPFHSCSSLNNICSFSMYDLLSWLTFL